MTDEELMNAYKLGEHSAFNLLFQKYSPKVYSYAKKHLKQVEVDDFYQSFWKHLHEKRAHYQTQPFVLWFYVIIRNLLTDEYRSRNHKKQLLESFKASSVLENNHLDFDLKDLLDALPIGSGELIKKFYLEGMSYQDLEKEMGMSQITLRKRLSRAMAQLKQLGGQDE